MTSGKKSYLLNVDKIILGVSPSNMAEVMTKYLKSATYSLEDRRRVLEELKRCSTDGIYDIDLYPEHKLSDYQYYELKHGGWHFYVAAIIEIAEDDKTLSTWDNIIYELEKFIESIGKLEMLGKFMGNKPKGIITGALMLGGLTRSSKRTLDGAIIKVVTPIKGTESMTCEDRILIAMRRLESLGIVDQVKVESLEELI